MYVVTDVALTPLSSRSEAETAIAQTKEALQKHKTGNGGNKADEESSDEDSHSLTGGNDSLNRDAVETPVNERNNPVVEQTGNQTTVAADVLEKKGAYGRFAERWFSRSGWSSGGRQQLGMSSKEDLANTAPAWEADAPELALPRPVLGSSKDANDSEDASAPSAVEQAMPKPVAKTADSNTNSFLPKILTTTKIFFSSRNFFFSYEYDLSRRYQTQQSTSIPLYKQIDPLVCLRYIINMGAVC